MVTFIPLPQDHHLPSPSTYPALFTELWHNRLGHLGAPILSSLHRDNFLIFNKSLNNFFCNSYPLGKQIKLPFYCSLSHTIIYICLLILCTVILISSTGHRYYVLFLDDYTNILWTFPLHTKSQAYPTFLQFRAHIKTRFENEIKFFQNDNGK
jgi:hypothetical protein